MKLHISLALGLILATAPAAQAITFLWEANLLSDPNIDSGSVSTGLSSGDKISGSVSWSDPGFDNDTADPDKTIWLTDVFISATLGNITAQFQGVELSSVSVDNDHPLGGNLTSTASIGATDNDANDFAAQDNRLVAPEPILINGRDIGLGYAFASFQLSTSIPDFYGADVLLNETIDISDLALGLVSFELYEQPNGSNYTSFTGRLTGFRLSTDPPPPPSTTIPLPAGAPLLLTGVAGFAWLRRRKAKKA